MENECQGRRCLLAHAHAGVPGGPALDLHDHLHAHGDYVHRHPHGHGPGAHGHAEENTPLARLDIVMVGICLIGACGYVMAVGAELIEGRVLRWREEGR